MNRLLTLSLMIVMYLPSVLRAQEPGDIYDVPVPGANSIKFRFCPPQQQIRAGDPRQTPTAKTLAFDIDGFYLSETELSRAQFAALLGQEALETLQERMKLESTPSVLSKSIGVANADQLPAVCTAFDEAVRVAQMLEQIEQRQMPDFVQMTIRLPSHVEWQYACRSGSTEYPHFSRWEIDWQSPLQFAPGSGFETQNDWMKKIRGVTGTSSLQEFAEAAWKAAGLDPQGSFERRQDQVVSIMENYPGGGPMDAGPHHAILCSCLFQSLGVTQGIGAAQSPPAPLKAVDSPSSSTRWGLRHAQTNVTEWVFLPQTQQPLHEAWADILKQLDQSDTVPNAPQVATHGAHFASSDWSGFLLWEFVHEPFSWLSVTADNPSDKLHEFWFRKRAGIRLLLQRSLKRNWLASVRRTALEAESASHVETLTQMTDVVGQLSAREKTVNEARARFYVALAAARTGNQALARQKFLALAESAGPETTYFKHLATAISLEESTD